MKNNLKENFQDEKSENDLSEFTDKEVFKGANALYKELKKENINKNNNIENKSNLKKISNDNTNLTKPLPQNVNPHNLLQNLIKNDNNNNVNSNNFISNNSISSSGFISFRNKKAKFVTLNTTNTLNNDNKIEEEMDADAITMSILEKLGMNNLDSNNLNDNKNNNNLNNSSSSNNKDSLSDKEKNIFWNLKSNNNSNENINNNKSIENNELIYNESHNNSLSGLLNNEPKEKYLNSVICTLSLIDRGKAVFVSQDDMIFVLPSLFVPKNLKVGNTYMFKVSEFLNFNKKTKEIYNLQKQYLKEDNNNFEI
jgi:hypothetical protein